MKYLPVVEMSVVDRRGHDADNERMLLRLKADFAKSNLLKATEIGQAAAAGDFKLAHRLAHSLRGNAGQIGERRLQEAAAVVEGLLADGGNRLIGEALAALENELGLVLAKLAPLLAPAGAPMESLDADEARALFEKLEPMLADRNPACMDLLDDVWRIPGAEEIARRIENLKFRQAAAALSEWRGKGGTT